MNRIVLLLVLAGTLALNSCQRDPEESTAKSLTWNEAQALNHQAVALLDQQLIGQALPLLRELVAAAPSSVAARYNLAVALLNSQNNDPNVRRDELDEAQNILETLVAERPELPNPPFTLGILMDHIGADRGRVRALFEAACRIAPEDPDCNYRLAKILFEAREPELERAVKHLRVALRHEPHFIGAWNTLALSLRRLRKQDEADEALKIFSRYQATKPSLGKTFAVVYNQMGRFAIAMPELDRYEGAPPETARPKPATLSFAGTFSNPLLYPAQDSLHDWPQDVLIAAGSDLRQAILKTIVPGLGAGIAMADFNGDGRDDRFLTDHQGAGRILFNQEDGGWNDQSETSGLTAAAKDLVVVGAALGDLDHDGDVDIYVYGAGRNLLGFNDGRGNFAWNREIDGGDAVTLAATMADADHDGDLDLLVANYLALPAPGTIAANAVRFEELPGAPNLLYNNNRPTLYDAPSAGSGVAPFTDIGTRTGFAGGQERTAGFCLFDLDRDGDLDIYLAEDGAPNRLLLNDRLWHYREAASELGVDDAGPATGVTTVDQDQDGRPDLVVSRGPDLATVVLQSRYPAPFEPLPTSGDRGRTYAADLDNDGVPELITLSLTGEPAQVRSLNGTELALQGSENAGAILPVDLDQDGKLDLLARFGNGSTAVWTNTTDTKNHWLALRLTGKRENSSSEMWSNTLGLGARVSAYTTQGRSEADSSSDAGPLAARVGPLHLGIGSAERADFIRVIWPDLVLQSELDFAAGQVYDYEEVNRKASSCPVLFKAGERPGDFDFVTDFLGVGGLGFLVAPGAYAPPDRTETVRIGSLPIHDGTLSLRVVEPMEEICYLDRLSLLEVRHPQHLEIFCDERLAVAEPMPTGRPLAWRQSFLPQAARDRAGRDTLAELQAEDRIYASGIVRDRRFTGYLAEEQRLELEFDAAAIAAARPGADARLWLVVDGWVEYPYSHVNFAAWQAGYVGRSFSLDLYDQATGTWSPALEDLGYPAGMTRCMTADLSAIADRDLSSLRLRTDLEIFVDRVRLVWELPSSQFATKEHVFDHAELRFLGYPEERSPDGRMPKLYDYQAILPRFDWKTMAGRYTRFGDVRELLAATDDRYVVMNHGEELVLELAAKHLDPLPEGWSRTWFLVTDGWCKDMDPYTAFPDTVAPLPSAQMENYPPPEPTAAPPAWQATWQTRALPGTFPDLPPGR
ncbi:MAG: VCBS repeat-containing protein [Planctomycetes bacterium]|nr:VCBS repeat-containing protein [Planctomycetota bacterium]